MQRFLKGAQLDDNNYKFVVSNINIKENATLYAQTKEAMLEFFDRGTSNIAGAYEPSTKVEKAGWVPITIRKH